MSKSNQHKIDPEVEEALAYIRQIMATDFEEPAKPKEGDVISFSESKRTTTRKRVEESSDILTLTEVINRDGSVTSLKHEEAVMAAKPDSKETKAVKEEEMTADTEEATLDLTAEADTSAAATSEIPAPEDTEVKLMSSEDMDALMSPEAVAQSAEAFNGLNQLASEMMQKIERDQFGNQTIEGLMREMLRPLLKEWLDSHLPSLVKWLVAEKIEQMIRERQESNKKAG